MNKAVIILVISCAIASILSLCVGTVWVDPIRALQLALQSGPEPLAIAIQEIRLPRTLLALFAGLSLGLSGAALQGLTRNPLADSGLLGVSSGAALGAVVALYFGFTTHSMILLPISGMAGAGIAVGLICLLAVRGCSIHTLILAGVGVSALCGSLVSLALNFAPNPYAGMEIVFWLLGSVQDRSWEHVSLAAPFILLGAIILSLSSRALQALSLGEETATSMGFSMLRLQLQIVLGTALMVGATTAVTGSIGFVGLVAPHLLRKTAGGDPGRLLPLAALGGALLLLSADIATRLLPVDRELKLGVITALIGAPIFIHMLLKTRKLTP